jgi:hypothetical protein
MDRTPLTVCLGQELAHCGRQAGVLVGGGSPLTPRRRSPITWGWLCRPWVRSVAAADWVGCLIPNDVLQSCATSVNGRVNWST